MNAQPLERRQTVLLAEDNQLMRSAVEGSLSRRGYRIIAVESAEKAITTCEQEPYIDVVVMDIGFDGGMDGITAAATIVRSYHIPVVFFTNFTEPEIVERASAISPYGYVIKSAGTAVLLVTVRNAIRLGASARRLRTIVENMPVMMYAFDAERRIVIWNRECERVTGYSEAEMVGNPQVFELLSPNPQQREQTLRQMTLLNGSYRDWEWRVTCKDGSERTISWSNISRSFPIDGWADWGVGVDVTKLRDSERELSQALAANHALTNELQHRAKNNLALMVNLVQIEELETAHAETREVLRGLRTRFNSLAVLQQMLYQHGETELIELDRYLSEIARNVMGSFAASSRRIGLSLKMQPQRVAVAVATPLGLILNEVLTNAVKYAFIDRETGTVEVTLQAEEAGLELVISNDGHPFPTDFDPDASLGSGLQLVHLLTQQLQGTIRFDLSSNPTIRLQIPR